MSRVHGLLTSAVLVSLAAGCAASARPSDGGQGGDDGAGGSTSIVSTSSTTTTSAAGPSSSSTGTPASTGSELTTTSSGTPETGGTLGVVMIDVQKTFVDGAANTDMTNILGNEVATLELAGTNNLPVFLTFEETTQGDHALQPDLQSALPASTQQFIKTTFDATHLATFHQAVANAGKTHFVVGGSETDVCVMQTVLGLRTMGFSVLLQKDAAFTSEPNTSPAVRRMQQAGVIVASASDVANYAVHPDQLPISPNVPVKIVAPLQMGVVLNNFTNASTGASSDPLKTQKNARLVQLLLDSDWFSLKVYAQDPSAGVPSAYQSDFSGSLRPLSEIAADTDVTQLIFAGTDADLAATIGSYAAGHDVFIMEDALLDASTPGAQLSLLAPLYAAGAVPETYKSFWYDMTKSVEVDGWPSQSWIDNFNQYWPITDAPEDLPAMPAD